MLSRNYYSTNLIVAIAGFVSVARFNPPCVEAMKTVGEEKVKVELYYESQCPGCRQMITTSFYDAFHAEGFLDMAEVEFVPYGNAQETPAAGGTYDFKCQHGPSECIYNIIEACALAKIADPLVAFQYIDCIERSDESRDPKQDYYKVAITCCEQTKLPDDTVEQMETCAMGGEGIDLEHEAASKTDALDPPHQYVPYVVVNGEHSDVIQSAVSDSLLNYVCGAYQGPNKSPACSGKSSENSALRARASIHESSPPKETEVCYRGDVPLASTLSTFPGADVADNIAVSNE